MLVQIVVFGSVVRGGRSQLGKSVDVKARWLRRSVVQFDNLFRVL